MSGPKAYTMREMRGIVEYLVEHKAYSEYRGRKMWVDFANSSKTNRTWQSLKETFLKRILPDIQNPYYRLTREQVCSFKQGTDVAAKERNRLEIQTVSEGSSNNEKKRDIEEPSTSAEKRIEAENPLGEKVKSATITARNRSSADTFILDDPEVSKKTTEELLAELEEPTTSMKDCINFEYSEPSSVVREVLQDFETESEGSDKEPQMEIVEDVTENYDTDDVICINQEVIVVEDSENLDNVEFIEEERIIVEGGMEVDIGPTFDHEIITEVSSTELNGLNNWLEKCDHQEQEIPAESNESGEACDAHETTVKPNADSNREESHDETEPIVIEDSENPTEKQKEKEIQKSLDNDNNNQNSLNTTTDTIIPNNQEVINDKIKSQKTNTTFDIIPPPKDAASRKRSTSQDKTISKKKKLENAAEKTNGVAIEITPPSSNNTEALFEALKKSDNPVEDSTMQEAQAIDESPQNKNPCLKSVSLFDEQFNTTKYSDSEEDTPIPNNKEKITDNVTAAEDRNQEKTAKDLPASDINEEAMNIDPPEFNKQEKTAINEKKLDKKEKTLLEKKQDNTAKVDPPIEKKNDKTATADAVVEKNHEETAKVDPPHENKLEETANSYPLVEKNHKEAAKVEPPAENKHEGTAKTVPLDEKKPAKPANIEPPVEKNPEKTANVDPPVEKKRDVIVLKSNSDSDEIKLTPERPKERFKHLAQAFGFVPGTSVTAAQRRRSLRSRNRTKSQRNSCTLQETSDWDGSISEPELAEEYVSPPRGRRNRHARKYRKPQSARIMSLEEDGALFVVHGNKVIPLVKNGKNFTFVTYDTLGCSEEEEELMWRQKYIEEKKKAAELKRQLDEATGMVTSCSNPPRNILSTTSSIQSGQNPNEIDMNKQLKINQIGDAGKIQITLSKNNEETINLEGHWPQVLPIVQQVMSMFYKPDETATAAKPDNKPNDISGLDTPIIPVKDAHSTPLPVARKVDDLENEIFKEIEEQDKKEKNKSNVTKRKAGRPKKTPSTSSEHSEKAEPAKRNRKSKQTGSKDKLESIAQTDNAKKTDYKTVTNDENKMAEDLPAVNTNKAPRKPSVVLSVSDRLSVESPIGMETKKTPAKSNSKRKIAEPKDKMAAKDETDNESVKTVKIVEATEPRVTRARKSGNETDSSTRTVTTRLSLRPKVDAEEEIRYMFPPEPKTRKLSKVSPNKTRSPEPYEVSQDRFRHSIDSTQGYQDSDPSPAKVNTTKRKRKASLTVRKGKHVPRRKSWPTLASVHDMSLDSSNSSYFVPRKSESQSTLDSAIYKTESYQFLMGVRNRNKKLDVIEESSKDDLGHFNAVSKASSDNSNIVVEGSSSNVSLPNSPEISVVENLSISRDMIRNGNHPTINEIQADDSVVNNIYNQYLISEVDVSVPLMQQDFELLNTPGPAKTKGKKQKSPIKVSELLNKVCTVNMTVNNTLSDSLDRKLRDLLLESAKKISDTNKENLMDVDETRVEQKTRGKKRCSTPRKRTSQQKTKPLIGPVIDEHMESCSHGGRNSCPPVISFIPLDENANNSADVQMTTKPKPKPRVKKDIIKVKIQRPNKKNSKDTEITVNTSEISVYTDSGINDTVSISGLLQSSDSVELIHNHSETCLQANECNGNSIEFVENSKSESIISINSTTSLESELHKVMADMELLSGGYRSHTKDASGDKSTSEVFGTPTDTVYHSPIASNCSLITEDLSDETPLPSTKWYLFSEDDTNTNVRPEQMTSNSRVSNFSASLKQLFPITCAVPDLSTISEMSKENEGSRKGLDTDCDTRSSDNQNVI